MLAVGKRFNMGKKDCNKVAGGVRSKQGKRNKGDCLLFWATSSKKRVLDVEEYDSQSRAKVGRQAAGQR